MPYKTNSELPKTVREKLPDNGQDIYRKAFNSAWDIKNLPNKKEIYKRRNCSQGCLKRDGESI